MEYKYHPVIKHLTYFILCYLFLRHQNLMTNQILIINTVILTLFIIILDHIFIEGHVTPFESLNYEYLDNVEIEKLEKELKREERRQRKEKKKREKEQKKIQTENSEQIESTQIDKKMLNELGYIKNNHPNQMINHHDYVDIYNRLDNTNNLNTQNFQEDQFDFNIKAYNE